MSPESAPSQRSRSRRAWKLLAAVVTVVSLAWVIWLLAKVWPQLAAHGAEIRGIPLLFGLALSLVASGLTFQVFATMAHILGMSGLPRRELAHLYFTAQLLKHLPGRVWGVGYQWAAGSSAGSLGEWLLINTGHALLATLFALWSACLALGLSHGLRWELVAAAGGGIVYFGSWMLLSSRQLWRWMEWVPGRVGMRGRSVLKILKKTTGAARFWIFLLFSISSIIYYASWFLYGASYPSLGGSAGVQLCALYMLAWFVGYISLLTPSGLGVRELVFAWLAKDFPGDAVALMAVVGRGSLLAVDLIMGLIFARFIPRKS